MGNGGIGKPEKAREEIMPEITPERLMQLVKAAYCAGFGQGFNDGQEHAVSYEWGSTAFRTPETGEQSWKENIPWHLHDYETETDAIPETPERWEVILESL